MINVLNYAFNDNTNKRQWNFRPVGGGLFCSFISHNQPPHEK